METVTEGDFQSRYAENSGVKLHYAACGPAEAPLVVMIHGFPDYWYTWRRLMETLGDAYRCAAPDLRGYNLSDQPKGVENYTYRHLIGDIEAVIRAEGRTSAIVIGHDWGASIAWNIAFKRPDLVERLVILSTPHPAGMIRELATNPEQQKNSQYARDFQEPGSEDKLTLERLMFWIKDDEARPHYEAAFKRSDWAAMMNIYRANYPRGTDKLPPVMPDPPRAKGPLLLLHGMKDKALHANGHSGVWNHVDEDVTLIFYPQSGHFIQQDVAAAANRAIRDWLDRPPVGAGAGSAEGLF